MTDSQLIVLISKRLNQISQLLAQWQQGDLSSYDFAAKVNDLLMVDN